MNINHGTGHFSGDTDFIRPITSIQQEKKPLFTMPCLIVTKEEDFKYTLKNVGPKNYLDMKIAEEKKTIQEIRQKIISASFMKTIWSMPSYTDEEDDSDEPDDPVEDGNMRASEGYIYDFNTRDRFSELSDEDKLRYLRKFPDYMDKVDIQMGLYGYFCPESPGFIPDSYIRKEGKYTRIKNRGPQLCDDPECAMISHAAIDDLTNNLDGNGYMASIRNSQYYELVPVYTRNKNHELCCLCLTK